MSADIVRVDAIRVEDRARADYRNIDSLAGSIETLGLLHPPVVTPDLRLVAGGRRLEAVKALGWDRVPVTVADNLTEAAALLQAESDENAEREPLTLSEAAALAKRIEDVLKPLAIERMEAGAKFAQGPQPKTREVAAKAAGVSHETIRKVRHVEEVVESESTPEPIREVAREALADMNATGKADAGYRRVKAAQKPVLAGATATKYDADLFCGVVAKGLSSMQRLVHKEMRATLLNEYWPIAKDDITPLFTRLFNSTVLREIAGGLNALADDMEAHNDYE